MSTTSLVQGRRRLRLEVEGAVQGVGFRPFLYRTARENRLGGWIRNDTRGVTLEVEGDEPSLVRFLERVRSQPPARAVVREVREQWLPATGLDGRLEIVASDGAGEPVAAVLPDLATCPACLIDIGLGGGADGCDEPGGGRGAGPAHVARRRSGYAFTNCTDCGPRFSIIRALPYDRPNTTMSGFALCPACRAEYEDPMDRRFHAQPTACADCGPRLRVEEPAGAEAGVATDPLRRAAQAIRGGRVVALKGLGGFHLLVDAANGGAVAALRERKHRPLKPLAVMVRDLAMARRVVEMDATAAAVLSSPEAPIVLLRRREGAGIADEVAPGNPFLGVMLPYTPLHHLLMRELDRPMVATSGNRSDEPICIDAAEAKDRLGGIADLFLVHDRPIERPVDDSVVQIAAGQPRLLRRSRGYAPLPVAVPDPIVPILAVGGHLKNTIALARGREVCLSQHIGDLDTPETLGAFTRVIADFLRLYDAAPRMIAHDLHPGYASSVWAAEAVADLGGGNGGPPPALRDAELIGVQHHHAHLASCLAENGETATALGVVWDGTGLGTDGTIWGGEFLLGDAAGFSRVAHFRPFRLPGGDAAVREPRRLALALAQAAWGEDGVERLLALSSGPSFDPVELRVIRHVLESGFRSPWTTSAGRLFDGVAAILGLRQRVGFEGEAAMALEHVAWAGERSAYPFPVQAASEATAVGEPPVPLVVDWAPALAELLDDVARGVPAGRASARFHNGLVAALVEVAARVGEPRVALTGGCFANRILLERASSALRARGFAPLLHRVVPSNDGGLALGQVVVAGAVVARRGGR